MTTTQICGGIIIARVDHNQKFQQPTESFTLVVRSDHYCLSMGPEQTHRLLKHVRAKRGPVYSRGKPEQIAVPNRDTAFVIFAMELSRAKEFLPLALEKHHHKTPGTSHPQLLLVQSYIPVKSPNVFLGQNRNRERSLLLRSGRDYFSPKNLKITRDRKFASHQTRQAKAVRLSKLC